MMKSLLFTELLEMVEEEYGYSVANSMVLNADLRSRGIYAPARAYHWNELNTMMAHLHQQTLVPFDLLAQDFGRHLCKRILIAYPQQKKYINRIFALITKKTEAPVFRYIHSDDKSLTLHYNPAVTTNCFTNSVIKGYLAHLQQLSRVSETSLPDGTKQYHLSLR